MRRFAAYPPFPPLRASLSAAYPPPFSSRRRAAYHPHASLSAAYLPLWLGQASEGSLLFKLKFILLSIYFFSTDGMLFFCFMCLATAILGITVSPFWFAFHLLDITTKSKDLQNVFKAVTQNGDEPPIPVSYTHLTLPTILLV